MVGDYISREAAISKIRDEGVLGGDYDAYEREEDVVNTLKSIPAADVVEVQHGRWINGRCSECGEHAPFWPMATTYHLSKYCHGCGARCDL